MYVPFRPDLLADLAQELLEFHAPGSQRKVEPNTAPSTSFITANRLKVPCQTLPLARFKGMPGITGLDADRAGSRGGASTLNPPKRRSTNREHHFVSARG